MIPDEDYYIEDGLMVMTAAYHVKRGYCCGNGCRWCPYEPKHLAGATTLSPDSEVCTGGNNDVADSVKS